jgi:hypothetical protein
MGGDLAVPLTGVKLTTGSSCGAALPIITLDVKRFA